MYLEVNEMRINKRDRGITLIALVVTIIVLLILAGVSISMLTGQNGILNRAADAKEKTEISSKDDQRSLDFLFFQGLSFSLAS